MKRLINSSLVIVGLAFAILILTAFMPVKYAKDFKRTKKKISSYIILKPYVKIIANNGSEIYTDSLLMKNLTLVIDSLTNDLLDNKYEIENLKTPAVNNDELYEVIDEIDNMPKEISDISFQSVFKGYLKSEKNRYALFISYRATYNPEYPPHYKFNSAMGGTVVITPKAKTAAKSDLCMMLFDLEKDKIVFYDRSVTSAHDPRVKTEIEYACKTMLRKIYYK